MQFLVAFGLLLAADVTAQSDARFDPTPVHRDTQHGHDHRYPDRGAVIRDLPAGATTVNYAGVSYRYHDGVWFEPRGPAFIVVAPPIGLIVPTLPQFATRVIANGQTYFYANETYYRSRAEGGGYEVVNAPEATSSSPARPLMMTHADEGEDAIVHPLVPAGGSSTPTSPPTSPSTSSQATGIHLATAGAVPPLRVGTTTLYVYPRNGQSADQQARDRAECRRFALAETGGADRAAAYRRSETACLQRLGYSVR